MRHLANKALACISVCFSVMFLIFSGINLCRCNVTSQEVAQIYAGQKTQNLSVDTETMEADIPQSNSQDNDPPETSPPPQPVPEKLLAQSEPREKQIIRQSSSRGILSAETSGPFAVPVYGEITSGYGMRDGRLHQGIDIAAKLGENICAVEEGTVVFAENYGGYGRLIKIQHKDGIMTLYAHCSEILVSKGQRVNKQQIIGLIGNSGNSRGPHLHFEVQKDGVPQDPSIYFRN